MAGERDEQAVPNLDKFIAGSNELKFIGMVDEVEIIEGAV